MQINGQKKAKMIQKRMKKCTGESGDIGDIAKNVKIAMQKMTVQIFIHVAWHPAEDED